MKIAIISNGFSGATLPLAQHLYDDGNIVDNYYIVTMGARCIESIDFSTSIPYKTTPVILPLSNRLYKYLSPHIKVTLFPTFRKMTRLEKMGVGKILPIVNRYLIRHYLKKIELNKYDVVNVVVHTEYEVIVCKELKEMNIPFVISYHEVLKQLTGNLELKQEVLQTINCAPIIVHSDNTRHELCQYSNISPDNVHVIHFGAFESYKSYDDTISSKVQESDYFLYLGYIKPYKGLKCLYDASKYLSQSIRFIIAGGGYDENLDKMKQNLNFKIINRFLSNEEVASLIGNCKAVVLPYISASQSGLVQTAMVYGKPVIATRVGAFSEIIKDKKNGILVQPANATELANAINSFDQYEFASVYSEEYGWNYITHQYLELFKKLMKIINYKSGLGNQIYFYLFGKYLEQKYPGQKVYANYLKKFLVAHNGVEIQNVFDLELPPQTLWSKIVAFCCRKLNGIGFNFLKCTDEEYSESAIYFDGYWQDKKYFLDNLKSLRFRKFDLDKTNFELKKSILESESVCLHVRRGDYLSPVNKPIYGGICTLDYYKNAIEIAKQKFSHPVFFVFSNDIDWVKANLDVKDAIFITNNQGKNSYLDLYLMTFCKGAIIANSSFSYWGSMLNAQYKDFVIYPKKWWNTIKIPDIFPDSWIGI